MNQTVWLYRDLRRDAGCFTVGFYDPQGKWEPESDHATSEAAAARVHYLNGAAANFAAAVREVERGT